MAYWTTLNTNTQALTSTPTALTVSGTNASSCGINIEASAIGARAGRYAAHGNIQITATTAGIVYLAWYLNGVILPETKRSVTAAVGNTSIDTDALRKLACCAVVPANLQLFAWTDGTAAASVTQVTTYGFSTC